MKKGKKAAQIGHVSLAAYRFAVEYNTEQLEEWENNNSYIEITKGTISDIREIR